MSEQTIETIELETAILVRRAISIANDKKMGTVDRSAYLLLHQISTHGAAGVKALADEFHLDISTVSRQTAALEQKGYVYRIPDPLDRRAYSLQITEKGAKELAENKAARAARFEALLKDWTEEEREIFGRLLTRLNRTFID